jgi:hypothetical protein
VWINARDHEQAIHFLNEELEAEPELWSILAAIGLSSWITTKQEKQVAEITGTDFFQQLEAKAAMLPRSLADPNAKTE